MTLCGTAHLSHKSIHVVPSVWPSLCVHYQSQFIKIHELNYESHLIHKQLEEINTTRSAVCQTRMTLISHINSYRQIKHINSFLQYFCTRGENLKVKPKNHHQVWSFPLFGLRFHLECGCTSVCQSVVTVVSTASSQQTIYHQVYETNCCLHLWLKCVLVLRMVRQTSLPLAVCLSGVWRPVLFLDCFSSLT